MQYKGYTGVLEIDEEDGILHGRVAGLRDIVTFEGRTVAEARRSFEESIDFYLKSCAEDGVEPDRPYSGKFLVRVDPAVHRALAVRAEAAGCSLNAAVEELLARGLDNG